MANLHIPLFDFWDYSPIEIDAALTAHYNALFEQSKITWEQTRLQIYYAYLLTPTKNTKVSFQQFKKDFIPLSFDEILPDEPAMSDETFEDIMGLFKPTKQIEIKPEEA